MRSLYPRYDWLELVTDADERHDPDRAVPPGVLPQFASGGRRRKVARARRLRRRGLSASSPCLIARPGDDALHSRSPLQIAPPSSHTHIPLPTELTMTLQSPGRPCSPERNAGEAEDAPGPRSSARHTTPNTAGSLGLAVTDTLGTASSTVMVEAVEVPVVPGRLPAFPGGPSPGAPYPRRRRGRGRASRRPGTRGRRPPRSTCAFR